MTGRELAASLGLPIEIKHPRYDPQYREGVIPLAILDGTDPSSLLAVAHEAAHHHQHQRRPILFWFRWLLPVTWYLEWSATQEALVTVRPLVTAAELEECRKLGRRWLGTYL